MSVDTTTTDAAFDAAAAADDAARSETAVTEVEFDLDDDAASNEAADDDANNETELDDATPAEAEAEAELDTGTQVTFASLDLPKPLVAVLTEAGVVKAFPIQAATIPDALVGRDVLGRGRTGSGKTLAFGLPTLARLEGLRAKPRRPLALVLVPTRELAMQVEDALRPYARALHLRIRSVFGGAPMRKQIDGLRYGVELLVATPGRLSDLIERGECDLSEVDMAILDEADQMCDMGFLPHVCELMDQVAEGGQRLLFSATLDGAVDEIVKKYMNDPVLHEVDPQAGAVTTMSHHLLMVTPQHKAKVAAQIAGRHSTESTESNAEARSIFFVRTQMAVDRVTEQLRERGLPAAGLHGGMTQVARTKTLEDFKDGRTPVLVATDVAARGIHVDGIDLVVHIDPPRDSKDYLHRAGRTARAGQTGVVASLVLPKQRKQAQRMMDDAGVTAEETDAAPVGLGGKWESASSALVELTGAREVPEPGDVKPFILPVRERAPRGDFRGGDFRGGDRFHRDDRNRDRFHRGDRPAGSGERGSYDRRGPERRDGDNRGFGQRGTEGRSFEGRGYERRDGENRSGGRDFGRREGGFERRDGENRGGFGQRGGYERRDGENRGGTGYGRPGFDRQGAGTGRPTTDRPSYDRGAGRPSTDRPGYDRQGSGAGRPSSDRPGFDRQSTDRPGFDRQGSGRPSGDRPGFDRQGGGGFRDRERGGYQGRGFDRDRGGEGRSFGDRNTGDRGRGFNDRGRDDRSRGFNDRNGGRSFDRDRNNDRSADRGGDRPGYGDRRPR